MCSVSACSRALLSGRTFSMFTPRPRESEGASSPSGRDVEYEKLPPSAIPARLDSTKKMELEAETCPCPLSLDLPAPALLVLAGLRRRGAPALAQTDIFQNSFQNKVVVQKTAFLKILIKIKYEPTTGCACAWTCTTAAYLAKDVHMRSGLNPRCGHGNSA